MTDEDLIEDVPFEDDIDESLFERVAYGAILSSDEFGVEIFTYDSETEREKGITKLCESVEAADDDIERDIWGIESGRRTFIGRWDGQTWEELYRSPSAFVSGQLV
ncbi:hypothetical protein G6L37_02665 [Agrobacterium rubi]|nr:hypothetical protein [Agrobacterium rubi]NTF24299.1 hypothetical protein [Agrobacterium rubi]